MASNELRAVIARIRKEQEERGTPPLPTEPLTQAQMEWAREAGLALVPPPPADITIREEAVGDIPGVWYEPDNARRDAVILYFHGGGYMVGSPQGSANLTWNLAKAMGLAAFSADYTLSPIAPFPAAVNDACQAYRGLLALGYASHSIVVAGDSAGGGLVMACLLALRDAGDPLPAAALATSPWLDMALESPSIALNVDDDVYCTPEGLQAFAKGYLQGEDLYNPLASPVHGDLKGLPPLLVQTGEMEQLRDDGIRFVERANAAGVAAELMVIPGGVHLWNQIDDTMPESRESVAAASQFLLAHLPRQTNS